MSSRPQPLLVFLPLAGVVLLLAWLARGKNDALGT